MLYLYFLLGLFTSYSNDTYSRKYEKLPNIVIHACYRTLMDFFEKVWPANLALFVYVSTHYVGTVKKSVAEM